MARKLWNHTPALPLKTAPYWNWPLAPIRTVVMSDEWDKPYSREKAAYPVESLKANKFWPTVSRIDSAYGDRNLICTCAPVSEYA